jgi:2'-hydroxyisoflavone reductase
MGRTPTRREFIETGLKAGTFAALGMGAAGQELAGDDPARLSGRGVESDPRQARDPAQTRAQSILILGGSGVTGPHLVARALERGHSVTLFNRGRTEPLVNGELYDQVEQLIGDRDSDLTALEGRSWDAVIDNSGSRVEWTEATAELLRDAADRYVYTSSTGAYYPYLGYDIDEDTEVLTEVPAGAAEDQRGVYGYGVMKANSEAAARRIFGEDRTVVLRPTYIMGPGDGTDRFTYWPVRIARGGEVLVPGSANDPVQFVDSRDFAAFTIHLLETGTTGTFNVAGPASPMGMHAFVHGVHAAFNSEVEWVYVDDQPFLMENGVRYAVPWIMPYGNNWGSARVSNRRAREAGLTFRPLADSCRDIHDWWVSDAVTGERRDRMAQGMMAAEPRIIAAWRDRP